MAEGRANDSDGTRGSESCREYKVVYLEVADTVVVERRGKKPERIERVVTCNAAIVAFRELSLERDLREVGQFQWPNAI